MEARPRPDGAGPGALRAGGEVRPPAGAVVVAGRYRLRERLAVTNGSSVWGAVDEALALPVMVWVFPPGFRRAGAVVAAARAACRLGDPRLARVFDAVVEGEFPYVVTEWPAGRHLGDLLAAGPAEPASAAAIVAEAAGALAAAHAAGLAHLCLRPGFVWWNPPDEVKITGLGIAAALAGIEAADPALADTWGLGRLLYAALTGCWPGAERTPLPAAPRCGDQLCSPRQVRAGIPAGLDAVACRALPAQTGRDAGPPIRDPAQLAGELAQITGGGAPLRPSVASQEAAETAAIARASGMAPVAAPPQLPHGPDHASWPHGGPPGRTQPLASAPPDVNPPPSPAPAASPSTNPLPGQAAGSSPAPPRAASWPPARSPRPAGTAPRPQAPGTGPPDRRRHPATANIGSPSWPTQPAPGATGPARPAKVLLAALLMLATVALIAGAGWFLTRHATGGQGTALGRNRAPIPAQHSPAPQHAPWRSLQPASAQAFDPYGDGQNENNQLAPLAIDHNPATAWHTDWYTTPRFGNLKPGTGLLLNMGRTVTIARAKIRLGTTPGASLQLRVGSGAASLKDLPVIARETRAGGWVSVRIRRPVHARYLLIWFTDLPPDPSGTFQASVSEVRLKGRP
jgi:hypothetical protein